MNLTVTGGSGVVTGSAGAGATSIAPESYLLLFGDSRVDPNRTTNGGNAWPRQLTDRAITRFGTGWINVNLGLGGASIDTALAAMPGYLSSMAFVDVTRPMTVLINLGVNNMGAIPGNPSAFCASYWSVIDLIHAAFPSALIYLMRPWYLGHDSDADVCATQIGIIVAARTFCRLGPDERIFSKGADNGATSTYDGTHYSTSGNIAATAAWEAVLWP